MKGMRVHSILNISSIRSLPENFQRIDELTFGFLVETDHRGELFQVL